MSGSLEDAIAVLFHDLRLPVNSILGFTELLLMGQPGPLNPEQRRLLELVEVSTRELLSLRTDIFALRSADTPDEERTPEPVDARRVLEEVVAVLEPKARRRGVHLSIEGDTEAPVTVDGRALREVVAGLLDMALGRSLTGQIIARVTQDRRGRASFTELRVQTGAPSAKQAPDSGVAGA